MVILITGVTGFLGSNCAKYFSSKHEVYGILGRNSKLKIKDVKTFETSEIEEINIEPDIVFVFHAAVSSGDVHLSDKVLNEANVFFTEKILKKFSSSRFIYSSSVSVYDKDIEGVITEKSTVKPSSLYSMSKLMGENLFKTVKKAVIIRFSSLYGIGMKEHTLIPNYINQAFLNYEIKVWGDGCRKQNYFHISDALKFIERILSKDLFNHEVLLGVSSSSYSNLHIARIIVNELDSKILFVSEDTSKSFVYNNVQTLNLLNWNSQKNIDEGVIELIDSKLNKS